MNLDPPPSVVDLVTSTYDKESGVIDKKQADAIWKKWLSNVYLKITDNGRRELTATAAVEAGTKSLELNHATVVIASTIATSVKHEGLFVVKNTSASGTAAHTCTLTAGTWDGTNTIATLNAPNEALAVYFDSNGDGIILVNIGSVALS